MSVHLVDSCSTQLIVLWSEELIEVTLKVKLHTSLPLAIIKRLYDVPKPAYTYPPLSPNCRVARS